MDNVDGLFESPCYYGADYNNFFIHVSDPAPVRIYEVITHSLILRSQQDYATFLGPLIKVPASFCNYRRSFSNKVYFVKDGVVNSPPGGPGDHS